MIVVDTTFLVLLLDPASTQDENRRPERVRHFISTFEKTPQEIIVPAPALAELVAARTKKIDEIIDALKAVRAISIQPFDTVIAVETGERIALAMAGIPANQRLPGWKAAMKYDAMIAATAIVRGASALYTNDDGFEKYLKDTDVALRLLDSLPLPPEDLQTRLNI